MSSGFCQFSPEDRVSYAYGELTPERRQAFADHLADCRTCRLEVEELVQAASLCQTLRSADLPEPHFSKDQAPETGRPWWRRPLLFWTPVAAAAAAAVLLFVLLSPAPEPPGPRPAPISGQPAMESLSMQVAAVGGATGLRRALDGREVALTTGTELRPGDVLETGNGARVRLELDDGSELELGAASQLTLTTSGQAGDQLGLGRGTLACQVSHRGPARLFLVATPEASVRVVGTRFVVSRDDRTGSEVDVLEGTVAVTPTRPEAETVLLEANRRGLVAPGAAAVELTAFAAGPKPPPHRGQPSKPTLPAKPPAEIAKVEKRPGPQKRPAPAPRAPDAARPGTLAPESLEALVARLHEDTGWIFDQFRTDMKAGRFADVLRKLDNYLSDPDSPMRDEATFLKAVCLEKLDRKSEAMQAYRGYLDRWPSGRRAADSRASIRRLWSPR